MKISPVSMSPVKMDESKYSVIIKNSFVHFINKDHSELMAKLLLRQFNIIVYWEEIGKTKPIYDSKISVCDRKDRIRIFCFIIKQLRRMAMMGHFL